MKARCVLASYAWLSARRLDIVLQTKPSLFVQGHTEDMTLTRQDCTHIPTQNQCGYSHTPDF